jgi:anti-sigma regulatory factor (Ser/Thr protein kinase)
LTETALISRSFPAHPSSLFEVRRFLRERAAEAGFSSEVTDDIVLAASEACANAALHSGSPAVHLSWRADPDRVVVEVTDEGLFRRRAPLLDVNGSHGHGVPLMMALLDEVTIKEGTERAPGTVVRMIKYREP